MLAYLIHLGTLIAIYVLIALSYAIPVGYTGLLNLGQVGLVAVGAYTSALLSLRGVPLLISLPAAAVLAGLVGLLLAIPTKRIKEDYYALMTLGFIFVINSVLLNWIDLTQGPFGVTGIGRPSGFSDPVGFFILVAGIVVLCAAFVHRLVASPYGRALEAVRDDDLVAESLGKPVTKLRVTALTISAVLAGIGGALLAHFLQFINPQLFWIDAAVWILASLVIGGLASFPGAILGAVLLFAIFEPIRFLPLPLDLLGALRLGIFALLLLTVVIFRPKGLMGRAQLEG